MRLGLRVSVGASALSPVLMHALTKTKHASLCIKGSSDETRYNVVPTDDVDETSVPEAEC